MKQIYTTILATLISCSCATSSERHIGDVAYLDISADLQDDKTSLRDLYQKGPLDIVISKNKTTMLDLEETILFDYARPLNDEPAPLVIFHHGNKYIKEAHIEQVKHLASWGIHALSLQSKNEHNWLKNGRRINSFVKLIMGKPSLLSMNIDPAKIILAGHSFGGSAVTIASSLNEDVAGVILLDPAVVANSVTNSQKKVKAKAVLLGADPTVFLSRRRSTFYKNMEFLFAELSVTGATHNDAQNPPITKAIWGMDPTTTPEKVKTFTHLITASAFTLANDKLEKPFKRMLLEMKRRGRLSSLKLKNSVKTRPEPIPTDNKRDPHQLSDEEQEFLEILTLR